MSHERGPRGVDVLFMLAVCLTIWAQVSINCTTRERLQHIEARLSDAGVP